MKDNKSFWRYIGGRFVSLNGSGIQTIALPDKMRSGFFAILGMFSQGAMPLGSLLFGILLDLVKYYDLLTAMNLLVIIAVIIFLLKACEEAYEAKI